MGLTDSDRLDLHNHIAATLAKQNRMDVERTLERFGFEANTEGRDEHLSEGELEEHIIGVLGADADDRRLEDLDYDLHARGLADDLSDELEAIASIPGAPSSLYSDLTEGSSYLIFEETRDRIKAARIYVDLLEIVLEQQMNPADPVERYKEMRQRRYPHLKSTPLDFDDIERNVLLVREFPLVAWGPTFIYCFSVLERFLTDAVAIAARLKHRSAPSMGRGHKIESRLNALESLGFKLVLSPETAREIQELRPLRNRLAHELSLVADNLPPELRPDSSSDEDNVPTPQLVRRALRVVHDVVSVAENTFEMHAFDAEIMWHIGPEGTA
jgi:hypothetical protein